MLVLAMGLTAGTRAQDHKQTGAKAGQNRSGNPRNREQTINELGAVSKSELALPFVPQWRYLTDSPIVYAVMIDASKVYLPLARGRITCLDRASGALLWGTDLGGRMTYRPALSGKGIYVSSVKVASDGSESGGLLRVLDTTTGLTLWQHEYTRPFTSPIVLAGDKIYAGSADGALYALKLDDGSVIWKCQTADVVQGEPLVTAKAILFGSDDGALRGADPQTGREMWKFQTAGKIVDCPAIFDGHVFLGSGDGYVYCLTLDGIKLKWRFRAGAAVVAAPVIAQGKVLI
ncbi:MAG: PQQ-binding-like beta-propeller repeat protein, partial [Blastocatellia bacterium]